jgi:hypothetical protein
MVIKQIYKSNNERVGTVSVFEVEAYGAEGLSGIILFQGLNGMGAEK